MSIKQETPENLENEESATGKPLRPKGSFRKLNSYRRLHGLGYTKLKSCNLVPPKKLGKRCSDTCKKIGKLCEQFSDDDRQTIFDAFNGLTSLQLQREFICRHVETSSKKERRVGDNSRRELTNTYFLTIRKQRKKVCKKFFLETLAISEKMVRTAIGKLTDVGMVEIDKRGGRVKRLEERDNFIRQLVESHIDRFPRIKFQFCRSSDKEYLSSDLTLKKMYEMFVNEQHINGETVSYTYYSRIFHEKKLAFYHPKKEQCTVGNTFKTGDQASKESNADDNECYTSFETANMLSK